MAKKRRKPGPARKHGPGVLVGTRCQPDFLARLDAWRSNQEDKPSRPDALRRLAELGLTSAQPSRPARDRSADMAGKTIDRLADPSAPAADQAKRKRRLLKGPAEFRDMRDD